MRRCSQLKRGPLGRTNRARQPRKEYIPVVRHAVAVALIALAALAPVACRDVSRLSELGRALNDEFAPTRLGVSLADQILLTVTVSDPTLALASCEIQVAFAMRIGRFLRERYTGLDSLQVVNVAFAAGFEREDAQSRPHLPIRFRPAAVRAGLQAQDSTAAVGSCRAFEELNRP